MTDTPTPLTEAEIQECREIGEKLLDGLGKIILGQDELIRAVVTAALAGGHVLLEGLPGLGKTELVKGLARLLSLEFNRVQFTPDLLPGDITGGHVLQDTENGKDFVFRAGPIFCNVLLADEINRTSPKTQAALLEAMQERTVTIDGESLPLSNRFMVVATQNPIEQQGVYPLPEAQLDRFLFQVLVEPVGPEVLTQIIQSRRVTASHPNRHRSQGLADFQAFHDRAGRVHMPEAVATYIGRLCSATHASSAEAPNTIKEYVRYGASPRAAIAIAEAARVDALLSGKPTVGFDDVKARRAPRTRAPLGFGLPRSLGWNHAEPRRRGSAVLGP